MAPRTVWLHENALDSSSGESIGRMLKAAPKPIIRVNLSGNSLGDAGVAALLSSLDATTSTGPTR